jgi:hypothetical protein
MYISIFLFNVFNKTIHKYFIKQINRNLMSSQISNSDRSIILLLGEQKGTNINWYSSYDSRTINKLTEFQLSALMMKINSRYAMNVFNIGEISEWEEDSTLLLQKYDDVTATRYACIISTDKKYPVPESYINLTKMLLARGGEYTAKNFHHELEELETTSTDKKIIDTMNLTPETAYIELLKINVHQQDMDDIVSLINLAISSPLDDKAKLFIYNMINIMLDRIGQKKADDKYLDVSYKFIRTIRDTPEFLNNTIELLNRLIDLISIDEERTRLELDVTCRINLAMIYRKNFPDQIERIKEILDPIDDGDMEVVSQKEREEYYVLLGYIFEAAADMDNALVVYEMAIMLSEEGTAPSMSIAEAYSKIGENNQQLKQLEISTQQFLAASAIASSHNDHEFATYCKQKAAENELIWSRWLISSALLMRIEERLTEATFFAWRALKNLINAFSHATFEYRTFVILEATEIIKDSKMVLEDDTSIDHDRTELAHKVINDLEATFFQLSEGIIPTDEEDSWLSFHRAQIATMIPLQTPTFLLIANDGRLMCGGLVDQDAWEVTGFKEDLLSGALSAIMALITEVTDTSSPLKSIDAGQTMILIERTPFAVGALITDRDLAPIKSALKKSMDTISLKYGQELVEWDGFSINFSEVPIIVKQAFEDINEQV